LKLFVDVYLAKFLDTSAVLSFRDLDTFTLIQFRISRLIT